MGSADQTPQPDANGVRDLSADWPIALYDTLKAAGVMQMSYVPDAGHATLIRLFSADPQVRHQRPDDRGGRHRHRSGQLARRAASVVLMQSSGVGNCINMLSLPVQARVPLADAGDDARRVGRVQPVAGADGAGDGGLAEGRSASLCCAPRRAEDVVEIVEQAAGMAFEADQQIAVLIGQRLLGAKKW